MKLICLAKPRNYREHLVLLLLGLAGLIDSLVVIGTLGFVSCDLRPKILYDKRVDKFIGLDGWDDLLWSDDHGY